MRSGEQLARLQDEMRLRQENDPQERKAFVKMGAYLARQQKAVEEERRVTRLWGIPSSWSLVESYGRYYKIQSVTNVWGHSRAA